jgi:hypothetical protein
MPTFQNCRVRQKDLKSLAVELLASGDLDDSRGTEKRVELDSFPGDCIVDVVYMSNLRYISWTIFLIYDRYSEMAGNERRRKDAYCD